MTLQAATHAAAHGGAGPGWSGCRHLLLHPVLFHEEQTAKLTSSVHRLGGRLQPLLMVIKFCFVIDIIKQSPWTSIKRTLILAARDSKRQPPYFQNRQKRK